MLMQSWLVNGAFLEGMGKGRLSNQLQHLFYALLKITTVHN